MESESRLKSKIIEDLNLPKDLYLGMAIQTISGNREILIENYKGILFFTTEEVLIQAKELRIRITGKNLLIQYYTNDEMKIKGHITQICYE